MRVEIRFDYLCLFVPFKNEIVVVLPDLRTNPLQTLGIGPHHPFFRWLGTQQGAVAPVDDAIAAIEPRVAQDQTALWQITELSNTEIEIRLGNKPLEGSRPPIHHLLNLTGLDEGDFTDPSFTLLHKGFLNTPPETKPALPDNQDINIATRLFLRGGSFEIEEEGLSGHDFFLAEESDLGTRISSAKRVARQVLWRSDEIPDGTSVHVLFKPFDISQPTEFIHLRPANMSDRVIALSLRNCDEPTDSRLPGLPGYAPTNNFEPRVYQTLSAGYTGFDSVKRLVHCAVVQSGDSVCGPGKGNGVG